MDYDCTIKYYPGKANVVVDALSRRLESSLSHMRSGYLPLLVDLRALRVILEAEDSRALLATFHVRPLLVDQILAGQSQNPQMIKLKEEIEKKSRVSNERGWHDRERIENVCAILWRAEERHYGIQGKLGYSFGTDGVRLQQ